MSTEQRGQWSSKLGFIMVASGSAIGLGNIWRFPYLVGMNGGAAFVILYICLAVTVGITIMLAEFCIGRATRRNPVGAFRKISSKPIWWLIGISMLICDIIILANYGVVAGWTIKYAVHSLGDLLPLIVANGGEKVLNDFFADSSLVILFQVIAILIATFILVSGIRQGIEKACKILMPILFILLLILIVRSLTLDGAIEGLVFYLKPDFSKITAKTFLDALGQSFYSLSVGMGIMLTYGSYAADKDNLFSCGLSIIILDTLVALLAGFAIFPAVFAMGIEPTAGVGLSFVTLPAVFASMPAGAIFSSIFFILLAVAATTSIIAIEVINSFLIDEFSLSRKKATWFSSIFVILLGIPSAISLSGSCNIFGMAIFDFLDILVNDILLPIGAISISLFVGWRWSEAARAEITNHGQIKFAFFDYWLIALRFFVPVMILFIFCDGWLF